MPRTKKAATPRTPIRIPTPMMNEVDRIVDDHPELKYNRQQFIETAIREKIQTIQALEMEAKVKTRSSDG